MGAGIVVVGAGHCAGQLVARLRAEGFQGPITMIGAEEHPPYQRPPLSKNYLAGEVGVERVLLRPSSFYADNDIDLRLGARVRELDPEGRRAVLDDGEGLAYEHLVLATGATVRRLTVPGGDLPGIGYLREIADSDAIRAAMVEGARLVVVGGGYIGLEVASVAARRGVSVTVIETESRLMSRVVSPEMSAHCLDLHREAGVDVRMDSSVTGFEGNGRVERVRCADGTACDADYVVVGIGIGANDALATAAGLDTGNGVLVDEFGGASQPNVWAAGDCSSHPSRLYGRRVRLESVHNAMSQAKVVAANICAKETRYDEAPWFWSDQYDTKLQIVGLAQGADERILRGDPAGGTFTVFHLCAGTVIAAETVNGMRDHIACRKLVGTQARPPREALANPAVALKDLET